jgi:hypothetical protein
MTKKETLELGMAGLVGAAAGLLIALNTKKKEENRPPRSAPQLPIQIPATSRNFPLLPKANGILANYASTFTRIKESNSTTMRRMLIFSE